MLQRLLLLVAAVVLTGCAKRPDALKRETRLDGECAGGKSAYVYPISTQAIERAVSSGCYAPIGAWTDERDVGKGGTRKLTYDLRKDESLTLLCCW